MWKITTFICLLAFCRQANSNADCNVTCSNPKSQNSANIIPQITVHSGNPTYIITQDQNNNYFLIPKSNLNSNVVPSEQLDGEQNSNSHNTIFIVRPSKKNRPCDRNSSKSEKTTIPTTPTTADVTTSPPRTPTVTDINPSTTKLSTPTTKTTVKLSSIPSPHTTVKPPTQKISPPTIKTTVQPPTTRNHSTEQPNEKTKYPPHLSTTEKPWSTRSPHTKEPNTSSTPTIVTPTRNPKDPTGYDMYCLYDGMYRANNFTCDQYYLCINGIRYLMDCPYGLVFNDDLKVCDWLENVEGCNPPAFDGFSCPDEGYGFDDKSILKFRYRDSCSQYVACHKRKPRLLTCEDGNSFDENSNNCVNIKNVSNCKNVEYSY